jgi:hypothetical protein
VIYEGNLSNISPTIPLDISIKPGVVENVHIGAACSDDEVVTYKAIFQEFCDVFAWTYEEMSGIDPDIVVHEIKTYPDAKPIQQRLRLVHHHKPPLLSSKLKNFLKSALSIMWI